VKDDLRVTLINLTRRGGQVHYLTSLANAFSDGATVSILCSKQVPREYISDGVKIYLFDTGEGKLGTALNFMDPRTWFQLLRMIKDSGPDLVFVTGPHEFNVGIALLVKLFIRKPLVSSIHNPYPLAGSPNYQLFIEYLFRKLTPNWITHTEHALSAIHEIGLGNKRVKKIPMGLFSLFTLFEDPAIAEENIILYLGRIEPYKGLDNLIKILPALKAELLDWKVIIAGSGSLDTDQDLSTLEGVELVQKFLSDREVAVLVQRASIIVLPYKEASFSGIPLVAYVFAKPIVATDVGGLPEYVLHGQTGRIVAEGDSDELLKELVMLAKAPDIRQEMGQAGYKLFHEQKGWTTISAAYIDFFRELVADYESRSAGKYQ
jgi:glycosyltransferase involved in cell wall biosynthesis